MDPPVLGRGLTPLLPGHVDMSSYTKPYTPFGYHDLAIYGPKSQLAVIQRHLGTKTVSYLGKPSFLEWTLGEPVFTADETKREEVREEVRKTFGSFREDWILCLVRFAEGRDYINQDRVWESLTNRKDTREKLKSACPDLLFCRADRLGKIASLVQPKEEPDWNEDDIQEEVLAVAAKIVGGVGEDFKTLLLLPALNRAKSAPYTYSARMAPSPEDSGMRKLLKVVRSLHAGFAPTDP